MTGKTALGLLLITRGETMLNHEQIYWMARKVAQSTVLEGLEWGARPAEMLDALTAGFESAVKEYRERKDQSNAGH